MIVKKCDICGREIGMVNAHYQLIFDGGFLRKEKDICIDCFKRIADEIKQADTPQTDLSAEEFVEGMKNLKMEVKQTDCAVITDTSYQVLDGWQTREKPKTTDCPWK